MNDTVQKLNPYVETWQMIRAHPVFCGIDDEELGNILPFFRLITSQADELFIQEGPGHSRDLYLILDGDLEVSKKTDGKDVKVSEVDLDQHYILARLRAGDAIGELSFIKGDPRSASIKCITKSFLLGLDPIELSRLEKEYPSVSARIMKNMVGYVGNRLKQTSENEIKALRLELQNSILNSKANLFFSYVIGLLCVYNLFIHITTNLSTDANRASIISAAMILIFSSVLILMIRQSKLPVAIFGLTVINWKPALKESLAWTGVIVLILILTKWILIHQFPKYQDLSLFDFDLTNRKYLAFNFTLYGMHSPIQEFIARGVLQGSLQHFFTGRNVTVRAILVSNALFSATHVHMMSGLLGVIVFIPGLFWGWLYARQGNLIGVSISHLFVGWTALFFLNLESLF